jgi:hypothetical protein
MQRISIQSTEEHAGIRAEGNFENEMKVFRLRTFGRKGDNTCHISFIGPQYQLPRS